MNLVTGATGLVGSHMLAELLKQGERVRALYRSEAKKYRALQVLGLYFRGDEEEVDSIEWVEGDILDTASLAEAMEGVTRVYHTAGLVSFAGVSRSEMMDINMEGTANVVNACLREPGPALCHVSSIAAVGIACDEGLIDETCMLKPGRKTSPYALSKFRGELEVWRGINEGLQAVIVNPSVILGPVMPDSMTGALAERISSGLSFYPEGAEGFVDVRDVAAVMHRLMSEGISGERFILNAENRTFRDILSLMATELGKEPPTHPVRPWQAVAVAAADRLRSAITGTPRKITRQALRIAGKKAGYSNEKIIKQLGIGFIAVEESVRFMLQHRKDHSL